MTIKGLEVTDNVTLQQMEDRINHCFIRMDRITIELEDTMREHQFNNTELLPEAVKLAAMFLEFKEVLDGVNSLFHYLKDCVDVDRNLLDKLEARISKLESSKTPAKTATKKRAPKTATKKKTGDSK